MQERMWNLDSTREGLLQNAGYWDHEVCCCYDNLQITYTLTQKDGNTQTKQVKSLCVYTTHTKTSFSSYQCDVMEQGLCE